MLKFFSASAGIVRRGRWNRLARRNNRVHSAQYSHFGGTLLASAAKFQDRVSDVELFDPTIPGFDELDRAAAVLLVATDILGDRWRTEIVERHEELHTEVLGDEIIEQKEAHVALEVAEQVEEVRVPLERRRERASQVRVVAADALTRCAKESLPTAACEISLLSPCWQ
jgi:hypothetical protein